MAGPGDQARLGRIEPIRGVPGQRVGQLGKPLPGQRRDPKARWTLGAWPATRQVNLVVHPPNRGRLGRLALGRIGRLDPIRHPQHQASTPRPLLRPPHPFALNRIKGFADASRIDQGHRIALEVEMDLDDVPGGAFERRDDRRLAPGDTVEQARLARIGRTCDGDHQAIAQTLATAIIGQHRRDLAPQRRSLRQGRGQQGGGYVGLIGKIDPGLDHGERRDQVAPPRFGALGKGAGHLAERLATLCLRVRPDEVGEALDRREVDPAVLERPPRELAGFSRPQPFERPEDRQHRGNHRTAAVQMQLGHVLAGLAVGAREPQGQRLIEYVTVLVAQLRQPHPPRLREPARHRFQR